jgi:hypothetical protein
MDSNKYNNIKVYNKTYQSIEEVQELMTKQLGIKMTKASVVNFIIQRFKENLLRSELKK